MVCTQLPSPVEAQKLRIPRIYNKYQPEEDKEEEEEKVDVDSLLRLEQCLETCDPEGPVCVYISKIVKFRQGTMAFGRIFSGTIKNGDKVVVYTSAEDKGTVKTVTNLGVCMSKEFIPISKMPCGNTVVIGGVEGAILKEATITGQGQQSRTFKHMKFTVAPVVEIAVKPKNPVEIDKLAKGLAILSQLDQLVKTYKTESGEYVIAGAGDLHIEICISQLKEITGIEVLTSEPQVSYRETCIGSCEPQLTKSGNKLNRLFTECQGMNSEDLLKDIEENDLV